MHERPPKTYPADGSVWRTRNTEYDMPTKERSASIHPFRNELEYGCTVRKNARLGLPLQVEREHRAKTRKRIKLRAQSWTIEDKQCASYQRRGLTRGRLELLLYNLCGSDGVATPNETTHLCLSSINHPGHKCGLQKWTIFSEDFQMAIVMHAMYLRGCEPGL
jgi:hypothetical protein